MSQPITQEEILSVVRGIEEKKRKVAQNIRAKRYKIGILKTEISQLESEKA